MENLKQYIAGNGLRGYYEGKFCSVEQAWSYLSNRFLLSFPSTSGRHIFMFVEDKNEFGFDDYKKCREGVTEINDLPKIEVNARCRKSLISI